MLSPEEKYTQVASRKVLATRNTGALWKCTGEDSLVRGAPEHRSSTREGRVEAQARTSLFGPDHAVTMALMFANEGPVPLDQKA